MDEKRFAQHVLAAQITKNDSNDNGMGYDTFYSMLTSALKLIEIRNKHEETNNDILSGAYKCPGKPPQQRTEIQNPLSNNGDQRE